MTDLARPTTRGHLAVTIPLVVILLAGAVAALRPVRAAAVPPVRASTAEPVPPPATGGPRTAPTFRWPLDEPFHPARGFDPPPEPWLPGHRGVDLVAPIGARVRSAGPGVVFFAGMVAGRPVVTVGHRAGLRTTYEPVRPSVSTGARVAAGTPLGRLATGHVGCPAAACLHWGLRRGDEYLDPLALLGAGPVRLLPTVDPPAPARSRSPGQAVGIGGVVHGMPRRRPSRRWAPQRWASRGGRRTARRSYSSAVL